MPSSVLWLLALLAPAVVAVTELGGCGPCDAARCPALPPRGCPLGRVRDACGCCWQCGRGEGEACGSAGAGGWRCAAGLECVKSRKRRKAKGGPGPAAASGPAARPSANQSTFSARSSQWPRSPPTNAAR